MATIAEKLLDSPQKWCITGVAGFIGSHLLAHLLKNDQQVIGIDNFSTGYQHNLNEVQTSVTSAQWERFTFINGDIRTLDDCRQAVKNTDVVLHQAALGSVPRSIKNPIDSSMNNVNGQLNMLVAASEAGVKRFVYASSSSVYGDEKSLPKIESRIGQQLSPYAVTKYVNELNGHVFSTHYNMQIIGLRYFNVFGPRQNANGPYAAVIPKWIEAVMANQNIDIYGDGETSRDFCYIDNTVQANLLAATVDRQDAFHSVYNVALNQRTSLNELFSQIRQLVSNILPQRENIMAHYHDFRPGDVRHSLADISKIQAELNYQPTHSIHNGLEKTVKWHYSKHQQKDV